jgi:hypothetical protein
MEQERKRGRKRMTTTEAAAYLGLGSPHAARRQLHRWGVKPVSRLPGRAGENVYDADEVHAAKSNAPGRGARTDIKSEDGRADSEGHSNE